MSPYDFDYSTDLDECQDEDFEISVPTVQYGNSELLSDGRIDWRCHKLSGNRVADIVQYYDAKKALTIRQCGTHLVFGLKPDGGKILVNADFCRLRICPMCSWRRSYRLGVQMDQLFRELLHRNPNAIIFHFTVTVENVSAADLPNTIKKMSAGHRFMTNKSRDFMERVQGFYRSFEITYNENTDTYHPHYHYLLHMTDSYFAGKYMDKMQWVQLWRECAKLDYDPSISLQAVVGNANQSMTDAVLEVSKYPMKPLKYAAIESTAKAAEVLQTIDVNLKGLRLLAFGGTIKALRAELKQADIEAVNADLVGGDTSQEYIQKVAYVWRNGFYYRDFDNVQSTEFDGCQISECQLEGV